jgi:transcriptional regulator with XRE-family HTH domain
MPNSKDRDELNREIGQRIKAARDEADVSQEALGKAIGITQQQVASLEAGRSMIGAAMLAQIKTVLNVPPTVPFNTRALDDPLQRPPIARLVAALIELSDELQTAISDGVLRCIEVGKKSAKVIGPAALACSLLAHQIADPHMDCAACCAIMAKRDHMAEQ